MIYQSKAEESANRLVKAAYTDADLPQVRGSDPGMGLREAGLDLGPLLAVAIVDALCALCRSYDTSRNFFARARQN